MRVYLALIFFLYLKSSHGFDIDLSRCKLERSLRENVNRFENTFFENVQGSTSNHQEFKKECLKQLNESIELSNQIKNYQINCTEYNGVPPISYPISVLQYVCSMDDDSMKGCSDSFDYYFKN